MEEVLLVIIKVLLASLIMCFIGLVLCEYMFMRNRITLKYRLYWIDKIYKHQTHYVLSGKEPIADYSDMVKYGNYFWMLFTFNKDKMIKDKQMLDILKNYR